MAVYNKGNWYDRVSTNPTRRSLTVFSSTGSSGLAQGDVITADVARADTDVTTEGTAFNHTNMDAYETRVQKIFNIVPSYTLLFLSNKQNGEKSDFVLNERCDHYTYLGIYYVAPGGQLSGYTEINAKDDTEIVCSISYPNGDHTSWFIRSAYLTIPDFLNVRFNRNAFLTIKTDGSHNTISTSSSETLGIKRIMGIKATGLTPAQQTADGIHQ